MTENNFGNQFIIGALKGFTVIIVLVIAILLWIKIYDNTIRRTEALENKIDSIIANNSNSYSYSHIPTFENKTPEEGIDEALLYYDIKHPTIVKAQAILETAHFSSDLCVKNNNLFGLYDSRNKKYYAFNHWSESIIAYINYIQYKYSPPKDYYKFLQDIGYAEDPTYTDKLRIIVEKNGKRRDTELSNK